MKNENPDEILIAKEMLESLLERVKKVHESNKQPEAIADIEEDIFEDDCVASGLSRVFYGDKTHRTGNTPGSLHRIDFEKLLGSYDQIERIHHKNSILEFWNSRKDDDPVLYELASIIHAIPPSQTTVERAFSILNYILNPRRTRLSESTLEMILMINLNKDWVDSINDRDRKAL